MACKGSGVRIPVPHKFALNPEEWTALTRVRSVFWFDGCFQFIWRHVVQRTVTPMWIGEVLDAVRQRRRQFVSESLRSKNEGMQSRVG
jgi:hypothetical protein